MFSKDSNIETIAQLAEEIKKYISLKGEYFRLSAVEKIVRVLTALLMLVVLAVLLLLTVIFFSLSLAYLLAKAMGVVLGFAVVGGIYALLFILCISFRKSIIERPLVRFLASILME